MTKRVRVRVDWPYGHAGDMITWCKENRIPVIHYDVEPILSADRFFIIGHKNIYRGTRGLYWQRQLASTGSCWIEYTDVDTFFFIIRESDFTLWRLRFTLPGDDMTIIDL